MGSIIQYARLQLKEKFLVTPIKSAILYLSPVVFFVISWIIGSQLDLEKKSDRIINLEFIYVSTVATILYIVLNYRIAYEIIKEKQKFRRQYMHSYGFGFFKFYMAWEIIYAILVFISSVFIIGGVRLLGFLTNINIFLSFLEFYLFQLATVLFSLIISSFFPRLPIVGGGLSVLLQLGSAISFWAGTYFHDYKHQGEKLTQHSNLTSIANDIYEVRKAEKLGETVSFSNLFNRPYLNIFNSMSMSFGNIFFVMVLAVFVDLFLVSIHASRSRTDRKNKNYYLKLIENKFRTSMTTNSNSNSNSNSSSNSNSNSSSSSRTLPGAPDHFLDTTENQELLKIYSQGNTNANIVVNEVSNSLNRVSQEGIAISVKHLFKEYQKNKIMAISNVGFDVYDNEIFVIAGPKNSGKSTLMKILYGRQPSSYGSIYYHDGGEKVKEMGYGKWRSLTRNMGIAPKDDYMFMENLSVYDHIHFYESMGSTEEDGFVLLKELNFQGKSEDLVKNLSEVERTKLKIALALLKFPKYLFLEEPTANMSEEDRRCFWEAIQARLTHRVIVISTENMEEAVQYAQRIMVLKGGMIQNIGDSEYIKHHLLPFTPPSNPEHYLTINN